MLACLNRGKQVKDKERGRGGKGAIKVSKLESLRPQDPCGEWRSRGGGEGYLMVPGHGTE